MGLIDSFFDLLDKRHMSEESRNYNDGCDLIDKGEYKKGLEKLVAAAEKGFGDLALKALWLVFKGGDTDDKQNVARYFLHAVNNGRSEALPFLWKVYPHLGGNNKKIIAKSFIEAAEAGNPKALVYLGQIYVDGDICGRDIGRARTLFEAAASAGEMSAYYHLGLMVLDGYCEGTPTSEGIELIERAAEAGVGIALCKIGEMYLNGDHLPLDYLKAREYIQEAARHGCEEAEALYHAYSRELYSVTEPSVAPSRKRSSRDDAGSRQDEPVNHNDDRSTEQKGYQFQYSRTAKVCLTCQYWSGTREMNGSRTLAYTRSDKNGRSLGRCMHKDFMHIKHIQSYSYTCNRFCKWSYLG